MEPILARGEDRLHFQRNKAPGAFEKEPRVSESTDPSIDDSGATGSPKKAIPEARAQVDDLTVQEICFELAHLKLAFALGEFEPAIDQAIIQLRRLDFNDNIAKKERLKK